MEKLFLRNLKEDDEDVFEGFVFEHIAYEEYKLLFENSLITGRQYLNYKNYNIWYKIHKEIERGNYTDDNTQAFNYFLLKKVNGVKQAVAVIELRTYLSSKTIPFGNLTIDVRPVERENGYYDEALKLSLELAKSLNMDKVDLKILDTDKHLLDAIKKNYKDASLIKINNVYSVTFIIKKISNNTIEDYQENDNYIYVTNSKLYEDKISKGLIGSYDIRESIDSGFDKTKAFNYVYVCDKERFHLNSDGKLELVEDIEPYKIIKVTQEEFNRVNKIKKL